MVTVSFGEPVEAGTASDPQEVTAALMDRIGVQVDRASRSYPQRPRGAADRWWLPAHLGGSAPTVEEGLAMSRAASAKRRARRAHAR